MSIIDKTAAIEAVQTALANEDRHAALRELSSDELQAWMIASTSYDVDFYDVKEAADEAAQAYWESLNDTVQEATA